jgi:lipopolysaccharide transport system ATP-binding protein
MYVRLAFAVAAHLEPEILIVDEVLAVGDAEFQKKCLRKMNDVNGEGRTILFVSHNMAAVKTLCTQGIVLENGNLAFSGSNEDAINHYTRSAYSLSEIPLKDRPDRKGNGKLRVLDIKFLNNQNTAVAELTSGEYYKIQFNFERYSEIDLKQLTFVLQFKNENDEIVTTIATDEQGTQFTEIGNTGCIEVEINRLVFREGRYSLNYMISEKLAFNTPHIPMDHLTDVLIMNVSRGDYWNSGILNRPKGFIQESAIRITGIK